MGWTESEDHRGIYQSLCNWLWQILPANSRSTASFTAPSRGSALMWIRELFPLWSLGLKDTGKSIKTIYVLTVQSQRPDHKFTLCSPCLMLYRHNILNKMNNMAQEGRKWTFSTAKTFGSLKVYILYNPKSKSCDIVWNLYKNRTQESVNRINPYCEVDCKHINSETKKTVHFL